MGSGFPSRLCLAVLVVHLEFLVVCLRLCVKVVIGRLQGDAVVVAEAKVLDDAWSNSQKMLLAFFTGNGSGSTERAVAADVQLVTLTSTLHAPLPSQFAASDLSPQAVSPRPSPAAMATMAMSLILFPPVELR